MPTANLLLPLIMASQAQKHVTHNEALRILDGLVQLSVKDRDLTAPPGSPADGDRYLVAAGASGAWAGWSGDIALRADGAWFRLQAKEGWCAWVEDEDTLLVRIGSAWVAIAGGAAVMLSRSASGFTTGMETREELISGLSGASKDSTIVIPDRAIVLGVSSKVTTAITGATSWSCGIVGDTSKFGGSLGIALGSSNKGVIGPQAFYADTAIRLTSAGGNFSGGAVRIAIHLLTVGIP